MRRVAVIDIGTVTARLAVADVVIDTAGTLEHTIAQTDALWRRLQATG